MPVVMNNDYKRLLSIEVEALRVLLERRRTHKTELEEVSDQIARLKDGVIGLAALARVDLKTEYPEVFTKPVKTNLGLTDAVRKALRDCQDGFITPTAIRDHLQVE